MGRTTRDASEECYTGIETAFTICYDVMEVWKKAALRAKEHDTMGKIGKLRCMTSVYLCCGDKVLMLYRQGSRVVNDVWVGSAGGHFEEDELNDPEACVLRELKEELSVTADMIDGLELRYITLRNVGELRQNYYFFANLPGGMDMELTSDEGMLQWFPIERLNELRMPFSAQFVIAHYLSTGRYNHAVYGGIANGQTVTFVELTGDHA